jgi:carbonic anhydrase
VQQVATTNARFGAQSLQQESPILRDLIARKELKIVAAMHDVTSGRITMLE